MFVKVIRKEDGIEHTDTYECKDVSVWTANKDPKILMLRLDGQMLLSIEKKGSQVFYMNNEGKTIERVLYQL